RPRQYDCFGSPAVLSGAPRSCRSPAVSGQSPPSCRAHLLVNGIVEAPRERLACLTTSQHPGLEPRLVVFVGLERERMTGRNVLNERAEGAAERFKSQVVHLAPGWISE